MAWRCGSCRPIATCSPFPIANACHQAGTLNKKRTAHRRCTGGDFPPLVGCSQTVAAAAVVAARSGPRPLARARDQTILCQGRSTVTSTLAAARGRRCGQSKCFSRLMRPSHVLIGCVNEASPGNPWFRAQARPVRLATHTSFLFWRLAWRVAQGSVQGGRHKSPPGVQRQYFRIEHRYQQMSSDVEGVQVISDNCAMCRCSRRGRGAIQSDRPTGRSPVVSQRQCELIDGPLRSAKFRPRVTAVVTASTLRLADRVRGENPCKRPCGTAGLGRAEGSSPTTTNSHDLRAGETLALASGLVCCLCGQGLDSVRKYPYLGV